MPRGAKLSGLVVTFFAGVLLAAMVAAGGGAADTTTTETTTTVETTTSIPETSTVSVTTTVERTTTRILPVSTPATTTAESTSSGTAAWVWALLAILAVGLVVLIVLLARGGGKRGGITPDERRRHLDNAIGSWFAQGWAIESQTADSAVLRRGTESMLVSVDDAGRVTTRPLSPPA